MANEPINYQAFHDEVKKRLLDVSNNAEVLLQYASIPWFPSEYRSITVSCLDNEYILFQKKWDGTSYYEHYKKCYFLDEIKIEETTIKLNSSQNAVLELVLNKIGDIPDYLNDESYIVLDGIEYFLSIKLGALDKKYQWRIPTYDIAVFEPLLTFLKQITNK